MTNKRRMNGVYMAVLALCLFVFGVFGGRQMLSAFAEDEKVYTNVLADLQKDESFSVINYPEIDNLGDELFGVIQVIQVAESESGELYLYTYQPSNKAKQLLATEINMSLSESIDGTSLFPLTLLNTNGVFCKYLVRGVIVSSDMTRYYNISSIFRDYIKSIDGETGNDNTKNGVAYEVGKVFKAETVDGKTTYFCKNVNVIQILNPYADFFRYNDGLHFDFVGSFIVLEQTWQYTDMHYIAFDTDLPIDTLEEADISFYISSYKYVNGSGYTYRESVEHEPITIKGTESGGNKGDGWFSDKYEWKRIQSVSDFIKMDGIKEETKNTIKDKKWVLCFYETEVKREVGSHMGAYKDYGTRVSNVTILRLKFVTAGVTYNLGAVSDKVTEDEKPGNHMSDDLGWFETLCRWLASVTGVPARVWKIIICSLPFIILLPILAAVFPVFGNILSVVVQAIGKAFVWLFKGLWWLICLPFKGISALIRKIKERKASK